MRRVGSGWVAVRSSMMEPLRVSRQLEWSRTHVVSQARIRSTFAWLAAGCTSRPVTQGERAGREDSRSRG